MQEQNEINIISPSFQYLDQIYQTMNLKNQNILDKRWIDRLKKKQTLNFLIQKQSNILQPYYETIEKLLSLAKKIKYFKFIVKEDNNFETLGSKEIFRAISAFNNLQELRIQIYSGNNFTSIGSNLLFSSIQMCQNLKSLYVSIMKNQIQCDGIKELSNLFQNLKHLLVLQLNFVEVGLKSEGYSSIEKSLIYLDNLTEFSINISEKQNLNAEDLQKFFEGLKYLTNCERIQIYLNFDKIEMNDYYQIDEILGNLPSLKKLSLKLLNLTHFESQEQSYQLSNQQYNQKRKYEKLQHLQFILFDSKQYLSQNLINLRNLESLKISLQRNLVYSNQFAYELGEALKQMTVLQKLDFKLYKSNGLSTNDHLQIYQALKSCKQISSLYINTDDQYRFCYIGLLDYLLKIKNYVLHQKFYFQRNKYSKFVEIINFNIQNKINKSQIFEQHIDRQGVLGLEFAFKELLTLKDLKFTITEKNIQTEEDLKLLMSTFRSLRKLKITFKTNSNINIRLFSSFISNLNILNEVKSIKIEINSEKVSDQIVINNLFLETLKMQRENILKLKIIIKQFKIRNLNQNIIYEDMSNLFPRLSYLKLDIQFMNINNIFTHYFHNWIKQMKYLIKFNSKLLFDDKITNQQHKQSLFESIVKQDHQQQIDMQLDQNSYCNISEPLNQIKKLCLKFLQPNNFNKSYQAITQISQSFINLSNIEFLDLKFDYCASNYEKEYQYFVQLFSQIKHLSKLRFLSISLILYQRDKESIISMVNNIKFKYLQYIDLSFDMPQGQENKIIRNNARLVKFIRKKNIGKYPQMYDYMPEYGEYY